MDECRRNGQVPVFGNWDYSNELPITQYFESAARQVGLVHHYNSSQQYHNPYLSSHVFHHPPTNRKGGEKGSWHLKEQKREGMMKKGCNFKQLQNPNPKPKPTPVDEDLYKISPELLRAADYKQKRMMGFFCCG